MAHSPRTVRLRGLAAEVTPDDVAREVTRRISNSLIDSDTRLIPGLNFSLASSEDNTKMATVTLPTIAAFQGCLQSDWSSGWTVDDDFNGLTVLQCPPDADVESPDTRAASICAIHGLNGHAFETWMKDDVMWLRDFLPKEPAFERARIMTVGFTADLSGNTSMAWFVDFAGQLLDTVSRVRNSATSLKKRPIMFICHSFAGLVAIEAMLQLRDRSVEQFYGITLGKCGFMFLGAPLDGFAEDDWPNILLNTKPVTLGVRDDYLEGLRHILSSFVVNRTQDFASLDSQPPFYCFRQDERTVEYGSMSQTTILASTGLLGQRAIRLVGADHRSVCKFDSKNTHFELVCRKLQELWHEMQALENIEQSSVTEELKNLLRQALTRNRLGADFDVRQTFVRAYNVCFRTAKDFKWREAEASYGLLVSIEQRILGEEDPQTLLSMAKYAWTLFSQEKWKPAEVACREALVGLRKPEVKGLDHQDTLVTASDLGHILVETRQYAEAVNVLWGVPEALGDTIGRYTYDTIMASSRLGEALSGAGRYEAAEHYFRLSAEVPDRG